MSSVAAVFAERGPLAEVKANYRPRKVQVDMALAVEQATQTKQALVVEAGTGTGKTFAYLAPALLQKGKVVISTGTKNLQEQLYSRDLPYMQKVLKLQRSAALLKGRANYLCLHRMDQNRQFNLLKDDQLQNDMTQVRKWASTTQTGDLGELTGLAEDAAVLPMVTSTVDNCLGKDCPDHAECYLIKARRKAMEAEVVVINHHLFFADMVLKDTGFGELIPDAKMIVFDEAHQLTQIATEYFAEAVSTRQIQDICRDMQQIYQTELKDAAQLEKMAALCRANAAELRQSFSETPEKGFWHNALKNQFVQKEIAKLKHNMDNLYEVCKLHLGRSIELDNLIERIDPIRTRIHLLLGVLPADSCVWYQTTPKHLIIRISPLSIADKFADFMQQSNSAWIFTSATLSVDGNFDHFVSELGLDSAKQLCLPSPFDYPKQALLCVPRYLPDTVTANMKEALLHTCVRVVKASGGRCFLLFTSHAMLRHIAEQLAKVVSNPILVQGSTNKSELLSSFQKDKQAVLLATGAFWEGVDIQGEDLSCVLIDKLPFASPDDPLLQARMKRCSDQGKVPFNEIQIPNAVISLKQGAGRLIRDYQDKGVLVICDPRLVNKDYAKAFLASMPPMRRTRDLKQAEQFLAHLHKL